MVIIKIVKITHLINPHMRPHRIANRNKILLIIRYAHKIIENRFIICRGNILSLHGDKCDPTPIFHIDKMECHH